MTSEHAAHTSDSSNAAFGTVSLETFTADDAVELARVHRSGFVESRHVGSAVVMDAEGQVLRALGDLTTPIFPRSSLKPFQAAASLMAGAPLQWDQIAVAAGSHQTTAEQVASVRSILAKVGLEESALQCPESTSRDKSVAAAEQPSSVHHNCSGKHAAFLAACVESGWDLETYLDPEHPLQKLVVESISELAGETPATIGVDGCGAPLTALSLTAVARLFSALGAAAYNIQADARLATVATAMLDYPEFVHAPGKSNTVVMEELGVIAKLGAEGVLGLATQDGVSAVVKMLDGNGRANTLVGLELLVSAGALERTQIQPVLERVSPRITGGQRVVGQVTVAPAVLQPTDAPAETDH